MKLLIFAVTMSEFALSKLRYASLLLVNFASLPFVNLDSLRGLRLFSDLLAY